MFSSRELACRFCEEFRNGLVHERRIKNGGQFSYDFEDMVVILDGIIIVNPRMLLNEIRRIVERCLDRAGN